MPCSCMHCNGHSSMDLGSDATLNVEEGRNPLLCSLEKMDIWTKSVAALKKDAQDKAQAVDAVLENTSGKHSWIQVQYTPAQLLKRPRFCNVCREKLSGFPQHGWGCDVCKIKTHRKCMTAVVEKCKWTVEGSIPHHLQYISPENSMMPHQWVEGNLPPSTRCSVCEKNCGSANRLQDWRCLWCALAVHDGCLAQLGRGCCLGPIALSTVPPLAIPEVSADGEFVFRTDAIGGECGGSSPLLVLANSKSGDSQGQRMIRKFKRLLNPLQVFDIITTGPDFALSLFKSLDSFRVLVCGGDGTVGWVLSACDRLDLHRKCQIAVLPIGTGNDLARVLGWGHAFYNVHELPSLLQDFERAPTRMLDRWSVMAIEGPPADVIRQYEVTITNKVRRVLDSEEPHHVITAVRSLCVTLRELMEGVSATYSQVEEWEREAGNPTNDPITDKCSVLLGKLDNLMKSLEKDDPNSQLEESGFEPGEDDNDTSEDRARRDSLVGRANSLKKALKDILSVAERGIDQHNRDSAAASKRARFRTKRSKTTPSILKVSNSNLSSSSACSPPASPSPINRHRLAVEGQNWTDASTTSGCELSQSHSSNRAFSTLGSTTDARDTSPTESTPEGELEGEPGMMNSPCIGRVQPPTPGGTREHSAVGVGAEPGEPDRPPIDRDEDQEGQEEGERLFKPHSECQLYHSLNAGSDIKISHSDSNLYEHADSSSGSRSRDTNWSRVVKEKKRQSAVENLGQRSRVSTSPMAGLAGGSLIAELLLLNARVLGMAAGTREFHIPLDKYKELKTMNNYFGIGLDAKIAFDFHNKRERSEKTRSRSKLFLWYGMLGGREIMHRTYRNLEQRIRLECDGIPVELPSLQGLVILNIPSYSGGANFWGTNKEDGFVAQSFDDRLLEVVALFGVIHVATSRVPNVVRLQNHRIAQCRHVRIVILGNEPLPVQVDGEPWMQPPGIMQIVHKNRAQLLVKNPAFDATLKKWEEQKERSTAPSTPTALGGCGEEATFARRAAEFLRLIESELATLGVSSAFLEAMEMATAALRNADESVDGLCHESRASREDVLAAVEQVADLLEDHFGWHEHSKVPANQPRLGPAPLFSFEVHGDEPDHWRYVMGSIRQEMSREEAALREMQPTDSTSTPGGSGAAGSGGAGGKKRSRFAAWFSRQWRRRSGAPRTPVSVWSVEDVATWLGSLGLSQYATQFKANDVRGTELRLLERDDLKELGVVKIGHVKRIQTAISDLVEKEDELGVRGGTRLGTSLSSERPPTKTTAEPPSVNSL